MSTLRRPPSRWGLIPRTILFFAVVLLALGLFFGALAGVAALRLAYERRSDEGWTPPPADAVAAAGAATTTPPTTGPAPATTNGAVAVGETQPQRIALWAMAAALRGENIGFTNKRKDLIGDWDDADSYAEWTLPAVAPGEYHVDVTYSAAKDEGGDFAVSVAGQTLKGRAAATVKTVSRRKNNSFTTARLGTVKIPAGPATATVKPVAPIERPLMTLLRVDLVPLGSDAGLAVALAPPPPAEDMPADDDDDDGEDDDERDRRRERDGDGREEQERMKRERRREEAERQRQAADARRDAERAAKAARGAAGSVTGLVLIDTADGRTIERLRPGMTLNLAALPRERLSVRADVRGAPASVRFAHNGDDDDDDASIEENAPWTIRGDDDGRTFNAWPLAPGTHSLTVTPFAADAAKGAAGKAMSVKFTVIDEPDRLPPGGTITGFTLLDAERGAAVMTLVDDMTLDLSTLAAKRFTIRAEAAGAVGSVKLTYAGPGGRREERTENEAEFTLTNQQGASYDPFDLPPGRHKLSAVGFAEAGAKGRRGREVTIEFDVPAK